MFRSRLASTFDHLMLLIRQNGSSYLQFVANLIRLERERKGLGRKIVLHA